ncbi:MAG TPA: DUF2157 domain-containing protein [Holophaga sp.]|nr:DUF2157 domain-containing protein [Holophaga sp.]
MLPLLNNHLQRWLEAGLMDAETAERIRSFESEQALAPSVRLRWPILLALALGTLMVGAGTLLFVAAHWDGLSPASRFALVLAQVALFHLGGAWFTLRMPRLAMALHGLGTLALGAGIFLAGQIFNLQEHWPGGILLWALGAAFAWALLRDWIQGSLLALLAPAWLISEWVAWLEARNVHGEDGARIAILACFALALTYLTARRGEDDPPLRKALGWIGGLALLPLGIPSLALAAESDPARLIGRESVHWIHLALALLMGQLLSIIVAWRLRGAAVRWNLLALVWVLPLALIQFSEWTAYAWSALGCLGLVAWGLREGRRERLNLGIAGFALTVFVFYFAEVMGKLGRSLGLLGLGLLFLLGGWQLERLRRRLSTRLAGGAR